MEPMQFKMGAVPSPRDDRDFSVAQFVPKAEAPRVFPEEFRITYPRDPKNQGVVGSCVAHSVTAIREMQELKDTGVLPQYSVGFVYANRSPLDFQESGMIPRQALKHLLAEGVCYNSDFPYNEEYPAILNRFNPVKTVLLDKAAPHKITAYARINDSDELKLALMYLGPVTMCINVYESFLNLTKVNPVAPIPKTMEKTYGGHMITVVGWRKDDTWIILNSWGKEWGENGYCYLPFDYPAIIEAWSLTDGEVIPPPEKVYYRVIIDGEQRMALEDQTRAIEETMEIIQKGLGKYKIGCVKSTLDVIVFTYSYAPLDYENEIIRVIVDGAQKIALTGFSKAKSYAEHNFKGKTVTLECAKDEMKWQFVIEDVKPEPEPEPKPDPPAPEPEKEKKNIIDLIIELIKNILNLLRR